MHQIAALTAAGDRNDGEMTLKSNSEAGVIRILETDSLSDIVLIKSTLDAAGGRYVLQGENMKFIRPVDPAILMVEEKDKKKVLKLLKSLKLNYNRIVHR